MQPNFRAATSERRRFRLVPHDWQNIIAKSGATPSTEFLPWAVILRVVGL
jgi:hypothetical protein